MASSSSFYLLTALLFTTILISISEARDFLVGGSTNSWKIPSSSSDSLNKWAESNRFQIGDSLAWNFDAKKDSVLEVTREDYLSCNISSPIEQHNDGHTVVKLRRSGPHYFVGGAKGACEKGEKIVVVVMALRKYGGAAPAPGPVAFDGPAVAPTSEGNLMAVVDWGLMGVMVVLGMVGVVI